MDLPREYVLLGLRANRLYDGLVDAYTGDPALGRAVENEPVPQAAALGREAARLLAGLPDSGLAPERQRFLTGQLTGLRTTLLRLAGCAPGFVEEVEAYFQVRPGFGDTERYAAAHAALDRLLPGPGALGERVEAHRESVKCPPDRLPEVIGALSGALRDVVRADYGLPLTERVDYLVVTDEPWSGFNYYRGGFRSEVAVNADLPVRLSHLPALVAHESYPGHHTEHCRKEAGLVEGAGRLEHTIFLVNTPECLMAEGLADLGIEASVGASGSWGRWAEEIYRDLGLTFDGALAEAVQDATAPLDRVRQDAALLLHDRGAGEDEAVDHLRRWGLLGERRARQSLGFLTHPLWRAYITTYVEGAALLRSWLDARPGGMSVAQRFVRLLDEPLTPAALVAELAAAS